MLRLRLLPFALFLTTLSACDEDSASVRNTNFFATEPFEFEVDLAQQTEFELRGVSGTVLIVGEGTATKIRVTGEKRVESESREDAESHLDRIQIESTQTASRVTVETEQPSETHGRNYEVDYNVTLPEDLKIEVAHVNGDVSIRSIRADVAVGNVNGQVLLDDNVGDTAVALVNGLVFADVDLPPAGTIALTATNGTLDLRIPTDTSAIVTANLVNGSIETHNLTMTNVETSPTSMSGVLGGGNGTIRMSTVNGTIRLMGRLGKAQTSLPASESGRNIRTNSG